ncbi:MAG: shikimate dehydrogenase [Lentisphaeria bacterium]|nr:shikimate dehydrogenase [Lentisphaeria bacterium]
MRRYALFGWPVGHSLSPQMQNAGFKACGIDASYECIPVPPGELASYAKRLVDDGYSGWNVTVPYKEEMHDLCDVVAGTEAAAARTVNTVVVKNGRMHGYSTDGIGLCRALKHAFGFEELPKRMLFLGAGGAAQATATFCARHGVGEITIANRTLANAERIAAIIAEIAPECRVVALPLADAPSALNHCDVILQCTSLGLHRDDPPPIPPELVPKDLPLFDFVYTDSAFRNEMRRQGNPVADGLELLLQQGMESFRLWTDRTPPESAMRNAIMK